MHDGERDEGLSRGEAIAKGGLAAGAILGFGALSPYIGRALAIAGDNDVDTLNLLLRFEYMQVELYEESKARLNADRELREFIAMLAEQEHQHVRALTEQIEAIGGEPAPERDYAYFGYRPYYQDTFLRLAEELESCSIGAYNGAIPLLKSKDAVDLTASIVQIDGRHAAAVALRGEDEPAPEAFDPVRTEYEALNSVVKFAGQAIFETG
jgi:hypothetical protein